MSVVVAECHSKQGPVRQSGRVGSDWSDRIGQGQTESGWAGSGRVGSVRVGSGRVGSGRVGSDLEGSGRAGLDQGQAESGRIL